MKSAPDPVTIFAWSIALVLGYNLYYATMWTLNWPIVHDAPIMLYIARRILSGAVPYRDIFDMNMPGTYLLYMLGEQVFGFTDRAFRYFDITFAALGGLSIGFFCRRHGMAYVFIGCFVFMAYHLSAGVGSAGQRDFLMVPFLVGACDLIASYLASRRHAWRLALAGGLLGFAIMIKPTAAILAGFMAAVIAIHHFRLKRLKPAFFQLALLLAGIAVVIGAMLLWLQVTGAMEAFIDIVLNFIPDYQRDVVRDPDYRLLYSLPFLWPAIALTIAAPLLLRQKTFDTRFMIAGLGVVYGAAHLWLQNKGWPYHFYPLAAFMIAFVVYNLPRLLQPEVRPMVRTVLLAGFYVTGILASMHYSEKMLREKLGYSDPRPMIYALNMEVAKAKKYYWDGLKKKSAPRYCAVGGDTTPFGKVAAKPPSAKCSIPQFPLQPELKMQFFDGPFCYTWNAAYRYNWPTVDRTILDLLFMGGLSQSSSKKLLPGLLDSLKNEEPSVIVFSRCAYNVLGVLYQDAGIAKYFSENYRVFTQAQGYMIFVKIP